MPWIMRQVWTDLLFAHWRVPFETLRPLVPASLTLETWEGEAWLGVVPFDLSRLQPRALPPLPGMGSFPEINVRTYVNVGGRRGVYFFSLDAASPGAVFVARTFFRLPYRNAAITIRREGGGAFHYDSARRDGAARFRGRYAPEGAPFTAAPGSLDEWLTERYCLYTTALGRPWRLDIDHPPWALQRARATIDENTMAAPIGVTLAGAPLLHFAARQDMVGWAPVPARAREG
jgi:uncharacterized protein YqjF (DUF2071 family)